MTILFKLALSLFLCFFILHYKMNSHFTVYWFYNDVDILASYEIILIERGVLTRKNNSEWIAPTFINPRITHLFHFSF